MSNEARAKVLLQYAVDQSGLQEVRKASDTIRKAMMDIAGDAVFSAQTFNQLTDSLKQLDKVQALDNIVRSFVDFARDSADATEEVEAMVKALQQMGQSQRVIDQAVQSFNELRDAAESSKVADAIREQIALQKQLAKDVADYKKDQLAASAEVEKIQRKAQITDAKLLAKEQEKLDKEIADYKEEQLQAASLVEKIQRKQQIADAKVAAQAEKVLAKDIADYKKQMLEDAAEVEKIARKQAAADVRQAAKEQEDLLRDIEREQQNAIRDEIAARKEAANEEKQFLRDIERVQQDMIRDEIAARKEAIRAGKIGGNVDNVVEGQEGLRRTGSALNQLGFSGAGNTVRLAGDVLQVIREGQLLSSLIENVGKSFQSLPGLLGKVSKEGFEAAGSFGAIASVVAPAIIALEVFVIAIKVFKTEVDKSAHNMDLALEVAKQFYQEIPTLTTKSAQQHVKELENRLVFEKQYYKTIAATAVSLKNQLDEGLLSPAKYAIAIESVKNYDKELQAGRDEMAKSEQLLVMYNGAIANNAFVVNDAIEAEKLLAEYRKKVSDATLEGLSYDSKEGTKLSNLENNGTVKQIDEMIAANLLQVAQNITEAKNIRKGVAAGTIDPEAAIKRIDQIELENARLKVETDELVNYTRIVVKKREDEIKAAKDLADMVTRVVEVQDGYNKDRDRIEQAAAQREIEIINQKESRLTEIRLQNLQKQEDLLREMEHKFEDDKLEFERGNFDAAKKLQFDQDRKRIELQREDVKATQDHLDRIAKIKKQDKDKEFQFLLERNFLGILELKRSQQDKLKEEDKEFARERAARNQKLRESNDDLLAAFAFEAEQRRTNYERKMADDMVQYDREIQVSNIQKQRQIDAEIASTTANLTLLATKTKEELRIRYAAYTEALRIARLTGDDYIREQGRIRIALFAQASAQVLGMTNLFNQATKMIQQAGQGIIGSIFPWAFNSKAEGGYMPAGALSLVNDGAGGREGFNGVPFPPGLGMFMSMQPGNVNKSMSLNQTNHFSGGDMDAISRMIDKRTVSILKRVMGD